MAIAMVAFLLNPLLPRLASCLSNAFNYYLRTRGGKKEIILTIIYIVNIS